MMPQSNELRELWQCGSGGGNVETRELLDRLERRKRAFDRTIRRRNFREMSAGIVVAALFLWFAVHADQTLGRVADVWLAGCGIWIIVYLRRYSRASERPPAESNLAAYRQLLTEAYDRQIELLKKAKYWYVLPFWIGLLLSAFAYLYRTGDKPRFLLLVAWATTINVVVWWLNEGPGVRSLERKRKELEG